MRIRSTLTAALVAAVSLTGAVAAPKHEDVPVEIVTLDPGHFHAALVQKFMLPGVSPEVRVYAPPGDDLDQHLKRIESFNRRADDPTQWHEVVYSGADWFDRAMMPNAILHNVIMDPALPKQDPTPIPTIVVISGNNARKSEYITRSVEAGFNVLADKPMVIVPADLPKLEAAFATAQRKRVLLYDIMTERHEITTVLQRALSRQEKLFGTLQKGSPDDPAISKISVHNFSKVVAGAQLKRPAWFFDPAQQGAGIVDVMTHLVDLVQWEAFPEVALRPADAKVLKARRWTTPITLEQFGRVTGATAFPDFLAPYVKDGVLQAPSNGEMSYTLKGVHARTSVTWDFEAPPGAGDTHYSVMRGTRASLVIRQGAEQGYEPVLYVERAASTPAAEHEKALRAAVATVAKDWPGIDVRAEGDHFVVIVPEKYHVGHEAHFTQVTRDFLKYRAAGKLPAWEVPNMITKYSTIMQAYEMSR